MILTEKVNIKIIKSNLEHYRSKLNFYFNMFDIIEIHPSNLTPGSHQRIDVKCEMCGTIKNIEYRDYRKCKLNNNIYACSLCGKHKYKMTCLEKYGVETTLMDKNTQSKISKTNIEKYGVDNPFKSSTIQDKIKLTNLEKYGVENPLKNEEILNKTMKTNFDRYGVHNLFEKSSPFREGIDKKTKITLNTESVKERKRNTCLSKYGYINAMQNYKVHEKSQKSSYYILNYKNTNLTYRGTYELDFIDSFIDKIDIEQIKTGIKYNYENEDKVYFPDFYYRPLNLIIEIKSIYTYYADFYKNIEKQNSCISKGYNFIFIVDKNYNEFLKLISNIKINDIK